MHVGKPVAMKSPTCRDGAPAKIASGETCFALGEASHSVKTAKSLQKEKVTAASRLQLRLASLEVVVVSHIVDRSGGDTRQLTGFIPTSASSKLKYSVANV